MSVPLRLRLYLWSSASWHRFNKCSSIWLVHGNLHSPRNQLDHGLQADSSSVELGEGIPSCTRTLSCDQRCVEGRGHVLRRIISTLVARASSWKNHEAAQRQVSLFDAHGGNLFFVDDTLATIRLVAWCVMHRISPQAPRTLYVHIKIYFLFIYIYSSTIYLSI